MKKVVKFGGTSLADATQFKKVANIIKADKKRKIVVPSAPGKRHKDDIKVTDLLTEAYTLVGSDDFSNAFSKIKQRYQEIIDELKLNVSLDDEFKIIEDNLTKGASTDYLYSRGEYLNGILLANYLGFTFIDASDVIFIDESGNYDESKTDPILEKCLQENEFVVIPGFYGSLNDGSGEIKTFSRGGSDITGSIVAKNGHVSLYENWTDVSGFLIADPRIVKKPEAIATITYKELRELSYMGAGVLHENSIFPIRKEGISINIKNTNDPDAPGTLIVESTCHKPTRVITGIAGKKNFATIMIEKDMMNSEVGFGRKVLQVLEDYNIAFEHMPSGIDTMNIVVNVDEFIKYEQHVLAGIHRAVDPDHISIEPDLSLIAVVGRGMKAAKGTAAKIFTALATKDINIKMIDQGSSELNIIVGVKNADFEIAIRSIYNEIIKD